MQNVSSSIHRRSIFQPDVSNVLSWVVIVVFIFLSGLQAHKPLNLDNTEFPAATRTTAETGVPVYYRGEGLKQHLGLYHPPLYIYSMAAWFRLFSSSPASVRMFGAFCALLQGMLALLVGRRLGLGKFIDSPGFLPVYWATFLLTPFGLILPTISDIDTTVYGLTLTGLLLAVLDAAQVAAPGHLANFKRKDVLYVIAMLALCFWAKMTTVLLMIPIIPAIFIFRAGWVNGVKASAFAIIGGIGLFLVTYWTFGKLTGLNIGYSFDFLIFSFLNRGTSSDAGKLASAILNFQGNVMEFVLWMNPLTIFVWIFFWSVPLANKWRISRSRGLPLYIAGVLPVVCFLYYWQKILPFGYAPPKYPYVFWGLLHIFMTVGLFQISEAVTWSKIFSGKLKVLILTLGVCALGLLGRGYYKDSAVFNFVWSSREIRTFPALLAGIIAFAILIAWQARLLPRVGVAFTLCIVFAANFFVNFGRTISFAQTPYANSYDYGQSGIEDVVGYLRVMTKANETFVSMKDVGFMADRQYLESYTALFVEAEARKITEGIKLGKYKYAVFTYEHGQDNLNAATFLRQELLKVATPVLVLGSYVIFKPNQNLDAADKAEVIELAKNPAVSEWLKQAQDLKRD